MSSSVSLAPLTYTPVNPSRCQLKRSNAFIVPESENAKKLCTGIGLYTLEVLSSGGFVADEEPEEDRHSVLQLPIGLLQGCNNTRRLVAKYAFFNLDILGDNNLNEWAKSQYSEFYQTIKMKHLCHALSFDPSFINQNYKAFSEVFTVPLLTLSLYNFFISDQNFQKFERFDTVINTLKRTLTSDHFERIEECNSTLEKSYDEARKGITPMILVSGHKWHATGIIFWFDCLIYCNRGQHSKNTLLNIYKIPDPAQIDAELLFNLFKRHNHRSGTYIKEIQLIEKLKLEEIHCVSLKEHKQGICTYANVKTVIRVLLAIFVSANTSTTDWLKKETWEIRFSQSDVIYKAFTLFNRERTLTSFSEDLKAQRLSLIQNQRDELKQTLLKIEKIKTNPSLLQLVNKL